MLGSSESVLDVPWDANILAVPQERADLLELVRPEELALAASRLTKLAVSETAFTCSLPKIGRRQRKKK